MGNKTRHTANLVSDNNIFVDIASDRVGIGSTQPTAKLNVVGVVSATSFLEVMDLNSLESVLIQLLLLILIVQQEFKQPQVVL